MLLHRSSSRLTFTAEFTVRRWVTGTERGTVSPASARVLSHPSALFALPANAPPALQPSRECPDVVV